MLTFKRTTITINGEVTTGYRVEGLSTCLRGLQVAVVKDGDRWYAHEATTGMDLTPRSWAGGLSNKTRAGIIQIVAIHLQNAPVAMWKQAQAQLDFDILSLLKHGRFWYLQEQLAIASLTPSTPKVDAPTLRMFIAALISRSWCVLQCLHVHVLSLKSRETRVSQT